MIAVNYKGHKYYIEQQVQNVYDLKKNLLNLKFVHDIGFKDMKQMWSYLKLHVKKPKLEFLDEESFCEILSHNLHEESKRFKPSYYREKLLELKGLNYRIVKLKDTASILDLLLVVKQRLKMEFVQERIDYGTLNPSKTALRSVSKYISSPYGTSTKHYCYTIPFLLEKVLINL